MQRAYYDRTGYESTTEAQAAASAQRANSMRHCAWGSVFVFYFMFVYCGAHRGQAFACVPHYSNSGLLATLQQLRLACLRTTLQQLRLACVP
eukprot:1160580-Pelagomonas_calceolata.AAC.7